MTNQAYFIYTRFSYIAKNCYFFPLYSPEKNFAAYRDMIFAEKRLSDRLEIFGAYQLPLLNIAWQAGFNIFQYVLSSTGLPAFAKNRLERLAMLYPFLHIEYFEEDAPFPSFDPVVAPLVKNCPDAIVCSMILNDDDILSPKVFRRLQKYMNGL